MKLLEKNRDPVPEAGKDGNRRLEFVFLLLSCMVLPVLGFPVFALHLFPFSIQDLVTGAWLSGFLFFRLKALGCLEMQVKPGKAVLQFVIGLVLSLGLLVASLLAVSAKNLIPQASLPDLPAGVPSSPAILVFLNLCVWACFEELVFRVLLVASLEELKAPVFVQGIASTLAFGMFHTGNGLIAVIQALFCGALLFAAWARSRSLLVVITAHAGYNLLFWILSFSDVFR